MWIPVIIIALAVAMVVGPVMLMRPTHLQQRQGKLREYAAVQGLRVQLRQIPAGSRVLDDREILPVYTLPATDSTPESKRPQSWLLIRRGLSHEIHFSGHWDWYEGQQAAPHCWDKVRQLLPQLPADVVALGSGPQGPYVFWGERGDRHSIDRLVSLLSDLQRQNAAGG